MSDKKTSKAKKKAKSINPKGRQIMNGDILGDDMGQGPEVLGEADILGAVQRALATARPRRTRSAVYTRPPLAARPGQVDAKLRSYMGMGIATWVAADGTVERTLEVEPQESFRGERLVIATSAEGGAAAGLIFLRRIDVGTLPQSPSVEEPAPASMFSPDATYSGLDLQIAHRGMKIRIVLGRTTAAGAAVTERAAVGMYGEWIR